ncbi:response regulator transcription factor [Rhodococcus sp. NPDC055024]
MRPRLLALMERHAGLTVIDSPRGFGKTELAALWLTTLGPVPSRPVVWVPAPSKRMTPVDYWNSARALIQDSLESLKAPPQILDDPVGAVESLLHSSAVPFVLVFNRIDLVEGDEVGHQLVDLIVRLPGLKVIVTLQDRSATDLLDGVRVDEYLCMNDLRYTLDESTILFADAGIHLPSGIVHSICERVAGVPVLMKVALSAVAGLSEPNRGRERVQKRVDQAILAYVSRTAPRSGKALELFDFATTIAAARTVTPAIAAVVSDDLDVTGKLDVLESFGLIFRDGRAGEPAWYFAPSVRLALIRIRSEQGARFEDPFPMLVDHALATSDFASAVRYAMDGRQWLRALDILERHWADLLVDHTGLIRTALQSIPSDVLAENPSILVGRDLLESRLRPQLMNGDSLPTEPAELRAIGGSSQACSLLNVGTVQSVVLRTSGKYKRSTDITRKLAHVVYGLGDESLGALGSQLPALRLIWGVSHQLTGDLGDAAVELRLAYHGAVQHGPEFVLRHAAGNAALNSALIGDVTHATEWLHLESAHPDVSGWLGPPSHMGGAIARALVAYDSVDRIAGAAAMDVLAEITPPGDLWAFAAYAYTRFALLQSDPFSGLISLQRAVATHGHVNPCERSLGDALLTAARIDLLLASGEGTKALEEAVAAAHTFAVVTVSVARAHLLTGAPAQALELCREIDWSGEYLTRNRLESLLIECVALCELGTIAAAARPWEQARGLLETSGVLSALATIPRDLIRRLEERAEGSSSAVADFLESEAPQMYPAVIVRVQLTKREMDVLVELGLGIPIGEIARKLFVSNNTLKSHLRALYRKLGAHSREEAVAAAHRHNLLGSGQD